MFCKKKRDSYFLLLPLLISCSERKSVDLFDEATFWITDNSQIVINNYYPNIKETQFYESPFIMYNYKDSGYTVFSRSAPTGLMWRVVYLEFDITPLNGFSRWEEKSSCSYSTPKRVSKTSDYIPITSYEFYGNDEISEESKNKQESFFNTDSKITKYELNNVYLVNRCSYYAFNEDIHLCASDKQFSFATGLIKDKNNSDANINIILKATSNTSFKIYKFVDKEKVGDVLLEGTMSNITQEEDKYIISFESSQDYYFDGKYNNFVLEIEYSNGTEFKISDSNDNFIFPEDIE